MVQFLRRWVRAGVLSGEGGGLLPSRGGGWVACAIRKIAGMCMRGPHHLNVVISNACSTQQTDKAGRADQLLQRGRCTSFPQQQASVFRSLDAQEAWSGAAYKADKHCKSMHVHQQEVDPDSDTITSPEV